MTIGMVAVTPEGELRDITIADEAALLPALYEAIGCETVALVRLGQAGALWVDEDGLARRLTGNVYASVVARALGWRREPFVGTAVFTGIAGQRTVSIPDEVRELITEIVTGLGPGGVSEPSDD